MSIKHIIFDLGGVILNIDYNRTANSFKNLGVDNFDQLYSQAQQTGIFDKYEIGAISETEFLTQLSTLTNRNLNHDSILNAWNAMLLDLPSHRIKLLEELSKNYNLLLLSNTNQSHQNAFEKIVYEQFGENSLSPWFNKVYYSHQIGKRKPNTDVFQQVLNDQEIQAKHTLFIDDSPQHIHGAREIGIRAELLKDEDVSDLISRLL